MKKADIQVGEFYGVTRKAKWRGFHLASLKKGKVIAIGQTADTWSADNWRVQEDPTVVRGDLLDKQADIVVEYESGQRWAVRPVEVRIRWEEVDALKAEYRAEAEQKIAAFAAKERRVREQYEEWKALAQDFNAAASDAGITSAYAIGTARGTIRVTPEAIALLTEFLKSNTSTEVAA